MDIFPSFIRQLKDFSPSNYECKIRRVGQLSDTFDVSNE